MTEQELLEKLKKTTDFVGRQRLLKQLWQLRRQAEAESTRANAGSKRLAANAVGQPTSELEKALLA